MRRRRFCAGALAIALVLSCGAFPLSPEAAGQEAAGPEMTAEGQESSVMPEMAAEGQKSRAMLEMTAEQETAEPEMAAEQETAAPDMAEGQESPAVPEARQPAEIRREVIEIRTAEDFLVFAGNCSIDSWSADKRVVLGGDIDLTGADFGAVPVFAGIFDGQGHRITGFSYSGDGYVAGLFRYIERDGVVENLALTGEIRAEGEKECVGSLCGVNYGTIKGCSFQGDVSGRTAVGGLAGVNEGTGSIIDCSAGGHVTGYYSTGGIVGRNHGSVVSCVNRTCVNNDSEWVEEDDEMGVGIFLDVRVSESGVELFSGVDTGGIAGHSDGVVTGCANYGAIGYDHTGYNIGGIAGRQSGVLSACTNQGRIYGRKDVGGIVGQMEPYIQVDEAQSLRNEVNKLHDLMEKTLEDAQAGKNAVKGDFDSLAAYSDGAVDAGDALADQLAGFADGNLDQVQAAAGRMEQVMDLLPAVFDDIFAAEENFASAGGILRRIVDEIGSVGDLLGEYLETDFDSALRELQGAVERVDALVEEIRNGSGADPGQLLRLSEAAQQLSEAVSSVISSMSEASNLLEQQALSHFRSLVEDMRETVGCLQSGMAFVRSASQRVRSIVDFVNAQPDLRFVKLGDGFARNRENLHGQLKGMSASIKSLGDHASDYSDVVNEDLRAVNDQINVIFNLLADNLMNYGEQSVEEFYEEADEEDLESITAGKTADCANRGVVKGDINVGGIAGAMSIDEEDPEDNAAGNVGYRIGRRYYTKCIVTDCINEGFVTAKKDGAGGIVGYMRHGTVEDSESYGNIESTEGGYVGGICGESHTVIRRCYALCSVSGGRNVGGIAGLGDTLTDCYAMADCSASAGRAGAIAGQTAGYEDALDEEEVKVSGCRYVGGQWNGIDDISYAGAAEPISYQELLTVAGLPAQFWHLRVVFRVEDNYLGTQEVGYGESLSGLEFPAIPEREGFYGVWPDCSDRVMTGNLLIDGTYREDVKVVQSAQTLPRAEGEREMPYALAESRFTADTVLHAAVSGMTPPEEAQGRENVVYDISLEQVPSGSGDTFALRLYNPWGDADVWGYQDGAWTRLESRERGRYLQVDMRGTAQSFCVAARGFPGGILAACLAGAGLALVLAVVLVRKAAGRRKRRKTPQGGE